MSNPGSRCPRCGVVLADGNHELGDSYCDWLVDFKRRGGVSGVLKDAKASLNAALEQAKAEMRDEERP